MFPDKRLRLFVYLVIFRRSNAGNHETARTTRTPPRTQDLRQRSWTILLHFCSTDKPLLTDLQPSLFDPKPDTDGLSVETEQTKIRRAPLGASCDSKNGENQKCLFSRTGRSFYPGMGRIKFISQGRSASRSDAMNVDMGLYPG
jgi:hypothetical protein